MAPSRASLALARVFASAWRFRTLSFSARVFDGLARPCMLTRRFMDYRLHLDVSRSNAQRLLFLEGERFVAELPLLRGLVRPASRVVDVGANIGYYMLILARLAGPQGRIVAFEPEPDNLVELELNKQANGLANVDIRAQAVGAAAAVVSFARGINGGVQAQDGIADTVDVPQVTLDDALTGPVDFIKIDVEGYEGEVLQGARRCIERSHPSLFVEIHPTLMHPGHSVAAILDFLYERYEVVELFEPARRQSALGKVLSRYTGMNAFERMSRDHVMQRVTARTQDTFWATCRAGRT